jgi:hypothetical protein
MSLRFRVHKLKVAEIFYSLKIESENIMFWSHFSEDEILKLKDIIEQAIKNKPENQCDEQ